MFVFFCLLIKSVPITQFILLLYTLKLLLSSTCVHDNTMCTIQWLYLLLKIGYDIK